MNSKILFYSLTILFLINPVSAHYISGDIYIDESGQARFYLDTNKNLNIQGLTFETNRLIGVTERFTSKQNGIWKFNLNITELYDSILIDIHLPKNLDSIISLDGTDRILDIDNKVISLIDGNKNLDFSVNYKTEEKPDYFLVLFLLVILTIVILIYFLAKRKINNSKLEHILPIINDNEKQIIRHLMKHSMRQNKLRKTLNIPKASFSRYMINLEKKKLIIREGEGKNKIVRLK